MDRTADFRRVCDLLRSRGGGPKTAGRDGGFQAFNPASSGLQHRTSAHTGARGAGAGGGLPGTSAHHAQQGGGGGGGGAAGAAGGGGGARMPKRARTREAATFSAAAGNIGRNIHVVSRKLAELTRLVRQKRLVFQACTQDMNLGDEVDLEDYINRPEKVSGADIAAICQEAGLMAVRKNRYVILSEDFDKGYKSNTNKKETEYAFYR